MTHTKVFSLLFAIILVTPGVLPTDTPTETPFSASTFAPTIQVVILVHPYNKLLYLPYLLGSLEGQVYPKDRLRLHLITERIFYEESYFDGTPRTPLDESTYQLLDDRIRANDQTLEILKKWTRSIRPLYNDVELTISNVRLSEKLYGSEGTPNWGSANKANSYWTKDRYKFLIDTKNQELYQAFQQWSDYVLFLDSDIILTEPYTFSNLTSLSLLDPDLITVAPLLYSTGTYSNFWAGMDVKGYYRRTEDYLPILERKQIGTWKVPMIHTCVLIDARKRASRLLTFDPTEIEMAPGGAPIPYDDIIAFAKSAEKASIPLYIDNRQIYGYLPQPLSSDPKSDTELRQALLELELESLTEGIPFPIAPSLESYLEPQAPEIPDKLGVDEVYVINLRRRPERRRRMVASLELLRVDARFMDATDGKKLTPEYLQANGIQSMEGYVDPYHQRPMTYGEIGCFLSHFRIWEHAWANNHSTVIVLEDDVRFANSFRRRLADALGRFKDLEASGGYDFLYLGRKLNGDYATEKTVDSAGFFVSPGYSYWTIGYLITRQGVQKLLEANPLGRMLPVDEFLPLMYGSHRNSSLVERYEHAQRLSALSLRALLVSPTHYVGDDAYISDTEDSDMVRGDKNQPNEEVVTGPENPAPEVPDLGLGNESRKEAAQKFTELQPPPSAASEPLASLAYHLEL